VRYLDSTQQGNLHETKMYILNSNFVNSFPITAFKLFLFIRSS